ncbi:MAG: hypothetical protein IPM63_00015 [Acidobacteriota bacterium]|nr:MAG: hypothetical protein IPM63_00015 [Acidobacteriota bacterium]
MKIANLTLRMWRRHIRETDPGSYDNRLMGNTPAYPSPFSVLLDVRTGRGTIEGFLPLENPNFISDRGRDAMALLLQPMAYSNLPEAGPTTRELGKEMNQAALHAGISIGGVGVVSSMAGSNIIAHAIKEATFTANANAEIKAAFLNEIAEERRNSLQNLAKRSHKQPQRRLEKRPQKSVSRGGQEAWRKAAWEIHNALYQSCCGFRGDRSSGHCR